jgi:hypothetical protein
MTDPVLQKLDNLLGTSRARETFGEILSEIGLAALESAEDRARFGSALIARGGLLAIVGRSIVTQALLHGARETLQRIQTKASG